MALIMTKLSLYLFIRLLTVSLVFHHVHCNKDEDNLRQGLNSYRTANNLPAFAKNDKADCLADEIAEELEDQPCTNHTTLSSTAPGSVPPRIKDYQDLLSKCKIDPTNTRDGVILPVCVPNRVSTLILTNYTHTPYATYLNNSIYVGAGVGSDEDWMVVILTTNAQAGNFQSGLAFRVLASGGNWVARVVLNVLLLAVVGF